MGSKKAIVSSQTYLVSYIQKKLKIQTSTVEDMIITWLLIKFGVKVTIITSILVFL